MKDLKKIDKVLEGGIKTVFNVTKDILLTVYAYLNINLNVVFGIVFLTIAITTKVSHSAQDGVLGIGIMTLFIYTLITTYLGYRKRQKEE